LFSSSFSPLWLELEARISSSYPIQDKDSMEKKKIRILTMKKYAQMLGAQRQRGLNAS